MIESSTAAKGAGGALVLGGGGAGVYYASSREYAENKEESSQGVATVVVPADESPTAKGILVETLEDNDEYWRVVGEAYVSYTSVYSSGGEAFVTEIEAKISSENIRYVGNEYQGEIGKIIKDWCKDKADKTSHKFKYWCLKKPSRIQEIQREANDKVLKTSNGDFSEGDYEKIEGFLKEKNLEMESWRLGDRKSVRKQDKKAALLDWCKEQVRFLFTNSEQEFLDRLKSLCFK